MLLPTLNIGISFDLWAEIHPISLFNVHCPLNPIIPSLARKFVVGVGILMIWWMILWELFWKGRRLVVTLGVSSFLKDCLHFYLPLWESKTSWIKLKLKIKNKQRKRWVLGLNNVLKNYLILSKKKCSVEMTAMSWLFLKLKHKNYYHTWSLKD